jgi:hypothetical protein
VAGCRGDARAGCQPPAADVVVTGSRSGSVARQVMRAAKLTCARCGQLASLRTFMSWTRDHPGGGIPMVSALHSYATLKGER